MALFVWGTKMETKKKENEDATVLSWRDWKRFLRIMDSDAEPNGALKKAAEEYSEAKRKGTIVSED